MAIYSGFTRFTHWKWWFSIVHSCVSLPEGFLAGWPSQTCDFFMRNLHFFKTFVGRVVSTRSTSNHTVRHLRFGRYGPKVGKTMGWYCWCWTLCGLAIPSVPSSCLRSAGDESNGPILCGTPRAFRNNPIPDEQGRGPQCGGRKWGNCVGNAVSPFASTTLGSAPLLIRYIRPRWLGGRFCLPKG